MHLDFRSEKSETHYLSRGFDRLCLAITCIVFDAFSYAPKINSIQPGMTLLNVSPSLAPIVPPTCRAHPELARLALEFTAVRLHKYS
jgi:hypothetical protein